MSEQLKRDMETCVGFSRACRGEDTDMFHKFVWVDLDWPDRTLRELKLTEVDAAGQEFDPALHEATGWKQYLLIPDLRAEF